jgi:cysteine sulfinate desulfinase/cysteine desulfurase-like protein
VLSVDETVQLIQIGPAAPTTCSSNLSEAILTGNPTHRLPNNASFYFAGINGEAILLQLEERGILCSSGSVCAAGRDEPSHVLLAMGVNLRSPKPPSAYPCPTPSPPNQLTSFLRCATPAVRF